MVVFVCQKRRKMCIWLLEDDFHLDTGEKLPVLALPQLTNKAL